MIEITSGYELTTSITNIFILIFSIFGYVEIKDKMQLFLFMYDIRFIYWNYCSWYCYE